MFLIDEPAHGGGDFFLIISKHFPGHNRPAQGLYHFRHSRPGAILTGSGDRGIADGQDRNVNHRR
jgi:hypothetical protein